MKKITALAALAAAPYFLYAQGVSGSVALVSNYIDRGESLSDDKPALQAELVYDRNSGPFLGAALSTIHDPIKESHGGEAELSVGYGFGAGLLELEVGLSHHEATIKGFKSHQEAFIGAGLNGFWLEFSHGLTSDENDRERYLALSYEAAFDGWFEYWLHIGLEEDDGDRNTDYAAGLSREVASNLTVGAALTHADKTKGLLLISRAFGEN